MDEVLPLAFTMMVGPQIITAIILVTAQDVIKPSLAYIAGIAIAASAGTGLAYLIARLFGIRGGGSLEQSSVAKTIQTIIVVILIFAAIKTFLNRENVKLPKWMSRLQNATPAQAFKFGLLLIFLMPSDIAVMATIGINKASHNSSAVNFLPFLGLVLLIAATPLIFYLVFRKKAAAVMPGVRAWIEANSWVVSIAAYLIFIYLLW